MNANENFYTWKRSAATSQRIFSFSDSSENAFLTQHKYAPQDLNNMKVKRAKKSKKKAKKKQKKNFLRSNVREVIRKWLAMMISSDGDHYFEVRISTRIFWGRFLGEDLRGEFVRIDSTLSEGNWQISGTFLESKWLWQFCQLANFIFELWI